MNSPQTQWLTEKPVLRTLAVGFALVVILLGLADIEAVRGTRAIEDNTAQVGREQLIIARLLNDVQAEQNTLAVVLHQIAHMPDAMNREDLLRRLREADLALQRSAKSAEATPEAQEWRTLESTVRGFSQDVADVIRLGGRASPEALATLFTRHDQMVRLEQDLLDKSEQRIAQTDRSIEEESEQLANRSRWLLGTCLALAILCAGLTITFARRSIRQIEWQSTELSRVSWHMLQSQESAARRFSHELHDELGQSLAALKANLNAATPKEWSARRIDCLQLVDGAIANVRELSQLLRPVILDDFGLDAGLRWVTDRFGERTGVHTDYASSFHDRLPDEMETHLFRITQEALTNIARHSGATEVSVRLNAADERVNLSIEDNGHGLKKNPAHPKSPSLGMTGMRARAAQVGGSLKLSEPRGGGLRIDVSVPFQRQIEEHAEQEDPHPVS